MNKRILLLALVVVAYGCSGISGGEAERVAQQFVEKRVKFFAQEGEDTADLPEYSMDAVQSYQEEGNWVVVIHIVSTVENETKENDLVVKVDSQGTVVEFNGVSLDSLN